MVEGRPLWGRREMRLISAGISLTLVGGMAATGLFVLAPTAAVAASADPVADGSMSAEDFALKKAKETGQPYELVKARTQSSDTWAMPTGKWSVKRYGTPVRVRRGGAWVATDPTLQFTANGTVASKAVAGSVTFSGGGTGPFLSGVKDGRTFSLTWPKALPKPTLAGNVATYANVLPDVDLQLKAEVEGFSQLLIVKTAAAAKHPDLATLKFKLDTVGLNVSTDGTTGLIKAVNPAGQDVFTASTPMMWDSTTTAGSASMAKTTASRALVAAEGTRLRRRTCSWRRPGPRTPRCPRRCRAARWRSSRTRRS